MTSVTGTADRATERLPYASPSMNGGPPAASSTSRILVAIGIAFALGVMVAKFVDWRSHAHPRD
jgi:hypothetical protein